MKKATKTTKVTAELQVNGETFTAKGDTIQDAIFKVNPRKEQFYHFPAEGMDTEERCK